MKYLLCALLVWVAAGCNDDEVKDADFKIYSSKSDLRFRTAGESYTIIIHARGPWAVTECPQWASVTPSEGEGSCEATLVVEPNPGYVRRGDLTVEFDGRRTETFHLRQKGDIIRGLPVKWLFSADYFQSGKYNDDFIERNALAAETGRGTLGFYRAPENAGAAAVEREVSQAGHPVVSGILPGDYWLFRASAEDDIEPGVDLHVSFRTRSSAGGPRYWMLEYRDGAAWLPLGDLRRRDFAVQSDGAGGAAADGGAPVVVESFEYTFDLIEDLTGSKRVGTDNASIDLDFSLGSRIAAGTDIEVRFRCVSSRVCVESTDTEKPEDSEKPGESEQPTDPTESTEPSGPDDSTEPAAPDDPTEPTEPAEPEEPSEPDPAPVERNNRIVGDTRTQPSITVVDTEFAGIE